MLTTYDELAEDVKAHNGICSYTMSVLRDVHGAGKLGTTVIQNIGRELTSRGLGHCGPLKLNQWEKVKIYDKSYTIGKIIEALSSEQPEDEAFLQQLSDKKERARTIEKIKELVAELQFM